MNKGFVFSFESLISLLIFSILLITITQTQTSKNSSEIDDLIALKKANDLLKIWSIKPDIIQIKSDTMLIFENNASVYVDGLEIVKSKFKGESISTSSKIVDEFLIEHEISIIVYFN